MPDRLKKLASAYRRSGRAMEGLLFKPFVFSRWLKLGLLSLMEQLPFAGLILFSNLAVLIPYLHLLREHTAMLPSLLFVLPLFTLLGLCFQIPFLYASSRAAFAYLQMPLKGESSLWNALAPYARPGFWYFVWRAGFWTLGLLSGALLLGIPAFILSSAEPVFAWTGSGVVGLIASVFLFVFGFFALLTRDFVLPLMWARGLGVLGAWDYLLGLWSRHAVEFVLFYLMRLAVGLLVTLGIVTMGFFTCCLFFAVLMIPGIGQAVLQPVFLFFRLFPLAFLEELDPELKLLPR